MRKFFCGICTCSRCGRSMPSQFRLSCYDGESSGRPSMQGQDLSPAAASEPGQPFLVWLPEGTESAGAPARRLNRGIDSVAGCGRGSAYPNYLNSKQLAQLIQFATYVAQTHRAVVRRGLLVPALDKSACADGEAIAAVGVADLKNRAGLASPSANSSLNRSAPIFDHGEQRHRAVLHGHLHRESAPDLAVIDRKRPHLGLALGDARCGPARRAPSAPRRR